jgi:hypothetical protein
VTETLVRTGAPVAILEMPSPVTVPRSSKAAHVNSVSHFYFMCLYLREKKIIFDNTEKKCLKRNFQKLKFSRSSTTASIKACDSSPCHHGGTCVNSGDSFTCICKDGYEGPLCEADINNCNPFPWYLLHL